MALTKASLVDRIVYNEVANNLLKKQILEIVETVFECIKVSLEQGEKVKVSGFGNFTPRDKRARIGRNPKTGEPQTIEARRVVTFKGSPILKEKLNS